MAEFEERADQLSLKDVSSMLVDSDSFHRAKKKLLAPGAKLLVGPRGTGKTHLMRFTYSFALENPDAPLAVYANFSKYLHLEPLLQTSPDALRKFHSWVLAKLMLAVFDLVRDASAAGSTHHSAPISHDEETLRKLVSLLEQGGGEELFDSHGQFLTIDHVLLALESQRRSFGRKRTILLLDDAALSLADQYLIAFFQVFRLLKTETVAPKASVYPGSTQYGPTFHVSHETEEIPLWLSVEDSNYLQIMGSIADRRFDAAELSSVSMETHELLKYAAFGVPRVYLRMLRAYMEAGASTNQQRVNRTVEAQTVLIGAEYDSLSIKLPQFASVVEIGRKFFDQIVAQIVKAQISDAHARSVVIGLQQGTGRTPLSERMLRFLVEVGMLFPLQSVSHGPNRKYDRFIAHLAFVRQAGGFRDGKGFSPREISNHMKRPAAKHPVRRELSTLLRADEIARLKLDLPVCSNCKTARLNESQRFCHNCGRELVTSSQFEACMTIPLKKVPGISPKIISRIHSDTKLRTIGDVYSSQSPAKELRAAKYVGPVRATGLVEKVQFVVGEFLS